MHKMLQSYRHHRILLILLFGFVMVIPTMANSQETGEHIPPVQFNPADVQQAYDEWKADYVTTDGAGPPPRLRVLNENNATVSEGIAYGILLASIFDDQATLDHLWMFAADHLDRNGLMHWNIASYQNIIGSGAASDADFDMAMGMIYACNLVRSGEWLASTYGYDYCQIATDLIDAIWETEIDFPGSGPSAGLYDNAIGYEVIPGDLWRLQQDYPDGITNLSYFSPAYFRVFANFTDNSDWQRVIERNYMIADQTQTVIADNCSGLVPNWSTYDANYQYVPWHGDTSEYWGWDGARFAWRVALDRYWFDSDPAREHMNRIGGFFSSVGINNVGAEYRLNGTAVNNFRSSFFTSNAAAAIWAAPNPTPSDCGQASGTLRSNAQEAYEAVLALKSNNYYNDSWRVLTMALMTGYFTNPMFTDAPAGGDDGGNNGEDDGDDQAPDPEPTQEPDAPANQAPLVDSIVPQFTTTGTSVNVQITARDPEGTPMRYDDGGTLPPGLSIDAASGLISGTPASNASGEYAVIITVIDSDGQQGQTRFDWTITGSNTDNEDAAGGDIDITIRRSGTFNNQQAQFTYRIANNSGTVQNGLSLRLYFTPDNGNPASNYVLDNYYDSSRAATINGPFVDGDYSYFDVRYDAPLAVDARWEYQGNLRLSNWAQSFNSGNDWWVGNGVGAQFSPTTHLAVYANGQLIAGSTPNGDVAQTSAPEPTQPPAESTPPPAQETQVPSNPQPQPPPTNTTSVNVVVRSSGANNNQQTQFSYRLSNNGAAALSGLSVRLYFTPDDGRAAGDYVLDKYWDQSNSASVSGPVQAGNSYYYSINYSGTLQAGATWEYQGNLRLNNWAQSFNSSNDFWRSGGLGSSFSPTNTLPVYQNGQLIAGSQP